MLSSENPACLRTRFISYDVGQNQQIGIYPIGVLTLYIEIDLHHPMYIQVVKIERKRLRKKKTAEFTARLLTWKLINPL